MSKKSSTPKEQNYIFRKHANIGAADAIDDSKFLADSFINRGEIDILLDNKSPQCIILGRTGTGKTALLKKISTAEDRVIQISPEKLAITYISNNEVLLFFMHAGVNMDLFFRLLWRHVFAIEIIKERFQIINEERRDNFLQQMRDRLFKNKNKQEAIDYLLEWGGSFWKETDYRVREITEKLEKDFSTSATASLTGTLASVMGSEVGLNAAVAKKLTEEQKKEIVRHGQQVVDNVQIRILSEIIELLESDILDDRFKRYYITIDKLDEDWVNESLRYQVIRALLETMKDFNNKLSNVKIIAAVREDLLDRVFRYTRSSGYQEEKYQSMYLRLLWNEAELEELLDKRISQLIREKYTSTTVKTRNLFPKFIKQESSIKYFMKRTLLRPRDVIMFFNECIRSGESKAKLTQQIVLNAETNYSTARLRALGDEWAADYKNLIDLALLFRGFPSQFILEDYEDKLSEKMLEFLIKKEDISSDEKDHIFHLIESAFNKSDMNSFLREVFEVLFHVGIFGIRPEGSATLWSFKGQKVIHPDLKKSKISIHPVFYKALSISI